MKTAFLSMMILLSSSTSMGAPITENSHVVLRILSATWCGYCKQVKHSLLASQYLAPRDTFLDRGTMPIHVNGASLSATVEQIEMDLLPKGEKFYPAIDTSGVDFYPTFQVYVDGDKVFSNSSSELAHLRVDPYSASGLRMLLESFLASLN